MNPQSAVRNVGFATRFGQKRASNVRHERQDQAQLEPFLSMEQLGHTGVCRERRKLASEMPHSFLVLLVLLESSANAAF